MANNSKERGSGGAFALGVSFPRSATWSHQSANSFSVLVRVIVSANDDYGLIFASRARTLHSWPLNLDAALAAASASASAAACSDPLLSKWRANLFKPGAPTAAKSGWPPIALARACSLETSWKPAATKQPPGPSVALAPILWLAFIQAVWPATRANSLVERRRVGQRHQAGLPWLLASAALWAAGQAICNGSPKARE